MLVVWLGLAGCGRLGFDGAGSGPGPADGSDAEPAIGALACGQTRVIAELPELPLGLELVATGDGAIAAWTTAGAAGTLAGVKLAMSSDSIVAADRLMAALPGPVAGFGLVADGARMMLSAQTTSGALIAPLDATLQPTGAATTRDVQITTRAVAEPSAPGGPFIAAWIDGEEALVSELDASGAPIGTLYQKPAGHDVAIRHAAQRDVLVWSAADGGCVVWAFDVGFMPVLADPLVYPPGGSCQRSAITRDADATGTNLLAWLDQGTAHAQLGTDTDMVGGELMLNAATDDIDIATSATGFFVANASNDAVLPAYVGLDGTVRALFTTVPHVRGSPLRLIEHGPDALLISVGEAPSAAQQILLTRLCVPP